MTITALPSAPLPIDNTATFNSKAFALVAALNTFVTEANALGVDANADAAAALASEIAAGLSEDAAIAAANFKGAWSGLTGALAIPASVSHLDKAWLLTESVADVTTEVPGTSAKWISVSANLDSPGIIGGVTPAAGTFTDLTSNNQKLKAALGGSVTLSSENTASNFIAIVPAGTSTLVTNATLPAQLNATGSAPIYACRAWVNFNGTGTVAIRASGNVSSITDNGTGDYTVNFTTAMPDANYCSQVASFAQLDGGIRVFPSVGNASNKESAQTAASVRVYAATGNAFNSGTLVDMDAMYVSVFR